jgi:hypothetical protein
MVRIKTKLNKYTWDFDWFDDKWLNDDLNDMNWDYATLESRVTTNEGNITTNTTNIWTLAWRVTTLEWKFWITTSVTVKDSSMTDITLNFTEWVLTSVT